MQPFTPTHIIFVPGQSATPVLLDEGRCYTAAEWDAYACADWTYDDGRLLRLGQAVDGSSIEAVPASPPRLTVEEEAAAVVEAFAAADGGAGINCGGLWVGWGGSRTRIRPEWLLVLDTDELSSMAGCEIRCADVDAEAIRWMHELSLDSAAEWEFLELVIDRSELTCDAEAIRAPLLAALARAAIATASWVGDGQDPDTGSILCVAATNPCPCGRGGARA